MREQGPGGVGCANTGFGLSSVAWSPSYPNKSESIVYRFVSMPTSRFVGW